MQNSLKGSYLKKFLLILIFSSYSLCLAEYKDNKKYEGHKYDRLVEQLAEEFDLVNTIKTLIYIESKGGLYPINLADPSCGVTHININTYIKRHKLKNTNFNRNKACADLIASPKWAILNAIQELEYWKTIHCSRDGECTNSQYQLVIKSNIQVLGWHSK